MNEREDATLRDAYGALDGETADQLERIVQERRAARREAHGDRVQRIVEALEE